MPLSGVVPYPPDFAARYRAKGYWEDRLLGDAFAECFDRYATRTALVSEDGEQVTYGQVGARSERLARHLVDLGFEPLDRVVMQVPNIPEFVYLYFAFLRAGVVPLMALPAHRHHEIGFYLEATEAVAYAIPDVAGRYRFTDLAREMQSR
jgi:non-ribosomal peptide synthetase component E (peptide arylation enzyme)